MGGCNLTHSSSIKGKYGWIPVGWPYNISLLCVFIHTIYLFHVNGVFVSFDNWIIPCIGHIKCKWVAFFSFFSFCWIEHSLSNHFASLAVLVYRVNEFSITGTPFIWHGILEHPSIFSSIHQEELSVLNINVYLHSILLFAIKSLTASLPCQYICHAQCTFALQCNSFLQNGD